MTKKWCQEKLQRYIDELREESADLDYKEAGAIGMSPKKKFDITKHVSASANAAGGVIIYGISERRSGKAHFPEQLTAIDKTQFSKEWLEHVISNIRPRIPDLRVEPVPLIVPGGDVNRDVAYVVEIPQGRTAHQATNKRYYRRYNYEAQPMLDHEIRDVMNRDVHPDAVAELAYQPLDRDTDGVWETYLLRVCLRNLSDIPARSRKLVITFPNLDWYARSNRWNGVAKEEGAPFYLKFPKDTDVVRYQERKEVYRITYYSPPDRVLFPREDDDLTQQVAFRYGVDHNIKTTAHEAVVRWRLYADGMLPKKWCKPLAKLNRMMG